MKHRQSVQDHQGHHDPQGNPCHLRGRTRKQEVYRLAQSLIRFRDDMLYEWHMNFDDAQRAGLIEKVNDPEASSWLVLVGRGHRHHADHHGDHLAMTGPATPGPTPTPDHVGTAGGILKLIQTMTLTHVLIIALLVAIAIPTYILWRFVNDASLLNKFTSFYEEHGVRQDILHAEDRQPARLGPDPCDLYRFCLSGFRQVDYQRHPVSPARSRRTNHILLRNAQPYSRFT